MINGKMQTKKYCLECLTPIHIGNLETLSCYQYVYDNKTQMVYFLNEKKWIALLVRHNLLDKYQDFVTNGQSGRDLYGALSKNSRFNICSSSKHSANNVYEWLKEEKISMEELSSVTATTSMAYVNLLDKSKKNTVNDIHRTICQVDGIPYIPGSSIKGALRNAALVNLILQRRHEFSKYWEEIDRVLMTPIDFKKELGRIVIKIENQAFNLLAYEGEQGKSAVNSIMKGLLVSDAICTDRQDTVVVQKVDAALNSKGHDFKENKISVFRECIAPHTKLHFMITVDTSMLKLIGINSVEEILEIQKKLTQSIIEIEKNIFGTQYDGVFSEAEQADIFLGGGTGFLTKTIIYSLAPDRSAAVNMTKRILDKNFYKHKHLILDRGVSPRTLKIAIINGKRHYMGLGRIIGVNDADKC